MIRRRSAIVVVLAIICTATLTLPVGGWTPLPVEDDQNLFMPGTQPGQVGAFRTVGECDVCHGGYDENVEPVWTWRGSMMAQAARDPLWLACLAVADQDSIWAVGNPNAGDLCIRCHSPPGWLEGRSDPTNTSDLISSDYDGITCDFCHRMIDPFAELKQPDIPSETNLTALLMQNETYFRDLSLLSNATLFDGRSFLSSAAHLALYYGNGNLPNYIESGGGQYFVDPTTNISGPYWDHKATHQANYSRFHRSKMFCITCHDVSNPLLASVVHGIDVPEEQAAASYFHVERTASEFLLSAYGSGGASAQIPGVSWAAACQDCHMRDVTGKGAKLPASPTREDLPLHDMTGGNQWMLKILASVDVNGPTYDSYNYEILSGQKYTWAQIDVAGLQGHGQALLDGADRVMDLLNSAADLTLVNQTADTITLRIQNNGGHKLISGFPEGRRMFLNVKFYDEDGDLIGEINPYEPLITSTDGSGNEVYESGGTLIKTNEELVWEAVLSSILTGENKTFHFALATDRYKDNRIPPKGFDTSQMDDRLVQPRWNGEDAPDYFTSGEYAGGYDEVVIDKPTGTVSWNATVYYQTTSKEYIEFLRDEINGQGDTLSSPTHSGEALAYIIQTDSFFSNLKGWGDALWDLWLHNDGNAPVEMASVGGTYEPEEKDEEPSLAEQYWWLFLIILIVLIIGLLGYRALRKPPEEEKTIEEEGQSSESVKETSESGERPGDI